MASMSASPLSSLGSLPPETIPVQPDHFFGQSAPISPDIDKGYLDPNDDPFATRGIPVFKPNPEDFNDFEGYMNKIEPWGMRSGIVKIIPPREWTTGLPSIIPQLAHVKLRNPIEQQMVGRGGLFRQQNIEKRRIMSVREWAELCAKEELRAPTVDEAQGGRRYALGTMRPRARRGRASEATEEQTNVDDGGEEDKLDDQKAEEGASEQAADNDSDIAVGECKADEFDVDPASTLPTPPPTTNLSESQPPCTDTSITSASTKRSAAERKEAKEALDAAFLTTFEPHEDWLPHGMVPEDYTPEFCRTLERIYWRNCSLGRAPWYGADMKGSLFTEETKHWNVADLPSVLSRLLGNDSKISGVNTPYLYFGMWRATFAWHVEDMDLFSINYIHFGSPKHWYAVPQARSQALETTMKGYFPRDNTNCPQFLRHKSFLASPTLLSQSSVRPNVLVQHAGEFVVTFPRGYHAGFNLGFNCAESVNFALDSWIELGLRAAFCNCEADSVRIDVRGLIEAKEQHEREGITELEQNISTSRKRKVESFFPNGSENAPKRPKTSKTSPPSPESIAPHSHLKSSKGKFKPTDMDAGIAFPCCLCASMSTDGLLRVHDPPLPSSGVSKPADGVWRAHEACARVVPETWVDEVSLNDGSSGMEMVVWGVDGIVKDRWLLKCAACTRPRFKAHGAPIQCTKGKCSKAFHVSCAASGDASGSAVAYRVLEEIEKEVVLVEPDVDALSSLKPPVSAAIDGTTINTKELPSNPHPVPKSPPSSADSEAQGSVQPYPQPSDSLYSQPPVPEPPPKKDQPHVIKTIKKLLVEVLCSQHNPVHIAQKKANKDQKVRNDLAALPEMSRIRIRNAAGVFEVSLVKVHTDRGTVEVLWDSGQKREFRWGSIVWGSVGQTTGSKPTAEELAKQPQSFLSTVQPPTAPPRPLSPNITSSTQVSLPTPHVNAYAQSGHFPYQYVLPPDQSRTMPSHMPAYGMGQFRVPPLPPWPASNTGNPYVGSTMPHPSGGVQTPYHGYYSHAYYQHPGHATSHTTPASSSSASSSSASPQPAAQLSQAFCSLPPHFANYYKRSPYLPLAPHTTSPSSAGVGPPATTKGVSLAQPSPSGDSTVPVPTPTPSTSSTQPPAPQPTSGSS